MKDKIKLNQKAITESGLQLDALDAVIIAVMPFDSESDGYKEVSAAFIMASAPILGLKKDAVVKRMRHLESVGVIDRHPENQRLSTAYFRPGKNWGIVNAKSA